MKLGRLCAVLFLTVIFSLAEKHSSAAEVTYYLKQDEVKKFYDEFFSENYYKKFPEIAKKTDPDYDSDVELSISELRKKYPLDWVEKKYGKIPKDYCDDEEYPGDKTKQPNLICAFTPTYLEKKYTQEFEKIVSRKDFNEKEIKSSFVNQVDMTKDRRPSDVIRTTLLFFSTTKEAELNISDKKLQKFIFSPKIFLNAIQNMEVLTVRDFASNPAFAKLPYYQDVLFLLAFQNTANIQSCDSLYFQNCRIVSSYHNIYPIKVLSKGTESYKKDFDIHYLDKVILPTRPEITKNFIARFLTTKPI